LNGLRAEIEVYAVRAIDCDDGGVIPAYMDIADTHWDDDPRVQHWRRQTQLGRVPRREVRPKTTATPSAVITSAPTLVRDPRIKTLQASAANTEVSSQLRYMYLNGVYTVDSLA